MKKICLFLLILLWFTTTGFAEIQNQESQKPWKYCEEIRGFADTKTESMLTALNNDNYTDFSRDFNQQMRESIPVNKFGEMTAIIKSKFGKYISMEFVGIEIRENYITVVYKGKFSQGQDSVLIRSIFTQDNGKIVVAGFWLTPLTAAGNTEAGK